MTGAGSGSGIASSCSAVLSLSQNASPRRRGTSRGIAVILILLLLPVLFGVIAVTVDVGYLYITKSRLQGVADVAVLTAVASIDAARTYQQEDSTLRTRIAQTSQSNGLGSGFFSVATVRAPGADDLLLARVSASRDLVLFFSSFLGISSIRVGVMASAEVMPQQIGYQGGGLALFGELLVDATGNVFIDSYDSRNGPYIALSNGPDGRPYCRGNATIGGNHNADISGAISFHGDCFFGDNFTISGTSGLVMGNVLCGGTITAPPTAIAGSRVGAYNVPPFNPVPAQAPADILTTNDNALITGYFDSAELSDNYVLKKSSGSGEKIIYLPAGGRYYFREINLQSDVRIELQGDPTTAGVTTVYLDGPMTVLGGITNNAAVPKAGDLRILSVNPDPNDGPIKLGGNTTVYADIYAPQQDFTLAGGGVLVGRIFGRTLDLQGNTAVHYDEALPHIEGGVLVASNPKRSPHLVE